MKMQIAYLPGGRAFVVLSDVEDRLTDVSVAHLEDVTDLRVWVTSESVELEGDIALPPEGPTEPPIDPQPYVEALAAMQGVKLVDQDLKSEFHGASRPDQHATMIESSLRAGAQQGCPTCKDEIERRNS